MDRWTMVLEAVPALAAIRVDGDAHRPVRAELVDGDAAALSGALATVVEAEGSHPDHLVLVVPGDLEPERFADLTEAVSLAGLPDPSWLPDAVARVGPSLASWEAGTPAVVVDARRDDIPAWSVRAADDGVEIGRGGALDLTGRLDALLAGVVHAKLAVVAPELADALRSRTDAAARRDAAHLTRELREGRRLMGTSDGEEMVVSAGDAEVAVTCAEFAGLVEHALRETLAEAAGRENPDLPTVVVADRVTPLVERLTAASRATVLPAPAGAELLDGAVALVLPRPVRTGGAGTDEEVAASVADVDDVDDPVPTDGVPTPAGAPASAPSTALVLPPRLPVPLSRPPWWAVPALSALLVLALGGAATVLVTAPDPGAVAPIGLDRVLDPGR